MRKCWVLLKIQLLSFFSLGKLLHSRSKKDRLRMGLFALGVLALGAMIVWFVTRTALAFARMGLAQVLPPVMLAGCAVTTLVTTIVKGSGQLWGHRDWEIVMALPVRTSVLVASRLLGLYLMNLLFDALLLVPAGIVYAAHAGHSVGTWAAQALGLLLSPLLPMAVGLLLSVGVTVLTMRLPYKNLIAIVLSFGLFFGAMWASVSLQTMRFDVSQMMQMGNLFLGLARSVYPPAIWFADGLLEGDAGAMALFVAVSLAVGALMLVVLDRYYGKIQSVLGARARRAAFRLGAIKAASPLRAIYRKELRLFFGNYLYVLNMGLGAVLVVVLGGLSFLYRGSALARAMAMMGMADTLYRYLPVCVALLIGMSSTTCCALSLEGKSRWILLSAPVATRTIFHAKIAVNLTVTLPCIAVGCGLLAVGLRVAPAQWPVLFALPVVFAFFIAVLGIWVNLKLPSYDWTSPYTVIKRGMSVVITLLCGMVGAVALGAGMHFLPLPEAAVLWGGCGLFAAITVFLYSRIRRVRWYL